MKLSLKKNLSTLKKRPGVYIFKDQDARVIYVGKAKDLEKRLKHYFNPNPSDVKMGNLCLNIDDLETIVTSTEVEALLLESQLIKKHKPRYNVLLKDDKAYPYIRVNLKSDYPVFEIVRRFKKDDALYFGPYTSIRYIKKLYNVINDVFVLRKCSDSVLRVAKRPCINHQMHKCPAPCSAKISKKDYMGIVLSAVEFLKGRVGGLINEMKKEMILASNSMDYEHAARVREKIKILEELRSGQAIVNPNDNRDMDVITYKNAGDVHYVACAFVRSGVLTGIYKAKLEGEATREEATSRFIIDYYNKNILPEIINTAFPLKDKSLLGFLEKKASKVKITSSSTEHIKNIRHMADKNLEEYMQRADTVKYRWETFSKELSSILNVSIKTLFSIESYDVSNISGKHTVGVKVFFEKGSPNRAKYRKYKLSDTHRGDDLRAMSEMMSRRLKRVEEEALPGLILIDGGKTQLSVVRNTFEKLGFSSPLLMSIAKDRSKPKGLSRDKIYFVVNGCRVRELNLSSGLLDFFKMLRDETHRFAIDYHRSLRSKIK